MIVNTMEDALKAAGEENDARLIKYELEHDEFNLETVYRFWYDMNGAPYVAQFKLSDADVANVSPLLLKNLVSKRLESIKREE